MVDLEGFVKVAMLFVLYFLCIIFFLNYKGGYI